MVKLHETMYEYVFCISVIYKLQANGHAQVNMYMHIYVHTRYCYIPFLPSSPRSPIGPGMPGSPLNPLGPIFP